MILKPTTYQPYTDYMNTVTIEYISAVTGEPRKLVYQVSDALRNEIYALLEIRPGSQCLFNSGSETHV